MKHIADTILQKKLHDILDIFSSLTSSGHFNLPTPLDLGICRIWSVSVSPTNEIYLMDQEQQWYPLEETDHNYNTVLESLFLKIHDIIKQRHIGLAHLPANRDITNNLVA